MEADSEGEEAAAVGSEGEEGLAAVGLAAEAAEGEEGSAAVGLAAEAAEGSEGEEGLAAAVGSEGEVGSAAAEAAVGEEETRGNPKLCCTARRCREGILGTSDPRHHLG